MKYKPHNYQKYAEEFIIKTPECGCFYEPGLGKTVITLSAINQLMFNYFDVNSVLVIAPLRVARDTWSGEVEKWDEFKHLKISKVLGTETQRIDALNDQADIYIINRENVVWLVEYLTRHRMKFDMLVIDELSSFKSPSAKRFRALRKIRPQFKRVVGLTGTPASNSLLDLWSEVYLLDRGERLGSTLKSYRDRYFEPDKRNQNIIFTYKPLPNAEEVIYKKISDICVSMRAEDYIKMPERIDNFVEVSLSDSELKHYKDLELDSLLPYKDKTVVALNAATLAGKLLQLANGAVYDENGSVVCIHDRKLEALEELIEAANGKPVLVFYNYKHDRNRILHKFGSIVRDLITSEDINDWNNGKIQIAITHPKSTGHGLNLQHGGSIIIWFGLTWSLELYEQANARLWRQGQKNMTIIHHIITKGTIDEDVIIALENKSDGQQALMEAIKARIGGA